MTGLGGLGDLAGAGGVNPAALLGAGGAAAPGRRELAKQRSRQRDKRKQARKARKKNRKR
jgi:hypothetical protein